MNQNLQRTSNLNQTGIRGISPNKHNQDQVLCEASEAKQVSPVQLAYEANKIKSYAISIRGEMRLSLVQLASEAKQD